MTPLSRGEVAAAGGADASYVDRVVDLGIIRPDPDGRFSLGDARRLGILRSLEESGLPLDGIAEVLRRGLGTLDFADSPSYTRFATFAAETFAEVAQRTGVPFELLSVLRESIGLAPPQPSDRIREDELTVVPFIAAQLEIGIRPAAIERLMRAQVDSLRRIAEAEAEWFRAEVIAPITARGGSVHEIATVGTHSGLDDAMDVALVALYHSQQAQTWMANITAGFEGMLHAAGLRNASERVPAICFLDITGYTRLTQERGDAAAAAIAEELARLVKRSSVAHGGRPVKWLGDGVMFWFPNPASAIRSALEMVEDVAAAGLPPAHVGVHAGPVVMQEGDYYGQTVNTAARIADYARPGEVLVSDAVVELTSNGLEAPLAVAFAEIGPVELKGVLGPVRLFLARLDSPGPRPSGARTGS